VLRGVGERREGAAVMVVAVVVVVVVVCEDCGVRVVVVV
jgi:hypothetical protein